MISWAVDPAKLSFLIWSCLLSVSSCPVILFFFFLLSVFTSCALLLTMTFLGVFASPCISSCPTEQHSELPSTSHTCLFEQGTAGVRVDWPWFRRLSPCSGPDFSLPSVGGPVWFLPFSLQPPAVRKHVRMQVLETLSPVANVVEVTHLLKKKPKPNNLGEIGK